MDNKFLDKQCDAQCHVEKGKIHQSLGQTMLAIDEFNNALKLDKNNEEAKSYLEYIYNILDYRNIQHYDV